jgi:hypothetical protein
MKASAEKDFVAAIVVCLTRRQKRLWLFEKISKF